MPAPLVEFPADDPTAPSASGRECWGRSSRPGAPRRARAGRPSGRPRLGVHERGRGPGDTASLPYFTVDDLPAAIERVGELGGSVVHPGERWAICRDSEGSPSRFAAQLEARGTADRDDDRARETTGRGGHTATEAGSSDATSGRRRRRDLDRLAAGLPVGLRRRRRVAQVPLGVEGALAAGAGRGDRLAVGVVDQVTDREDAGQVGPGRAGPR